MKKILFGAFIITPSKQMINAAQKELDNKDNTPQNKYNKRYSIQTLLTESKNEILS